MQSIHGSVGTAMLKELNELMYVTSCVVRTFWILPIQEKQRLAEPSNFLYHGLPFLSFADLLLYCSPCISGLRDGSSVQ